MSNQDINMKSKVVNKYWLLKQLYLPDDIIQEISGYCFYDKFTVEIRNKKKKLLSNLTNPFVDLIFGDGYRFLWPNNSKKPLQMTTCMDCGNYKVASSQIIKNVRCNCFYNYVYDDLGVSIEDIENEIEADRDYREYRLDIIRYGY